MNNMSSYIIHEFERRNENYRKESVVKCSEFMLKFDQHVKRVLETDKSLHSFTVGFPSRCNKEVTKYLKDNSFDLEGRNKEEDEHNKILFRYNPKKNLISAMLFRSCTDPIDL